MKINNSPSFTGYSNIIATELKSPIERHVFFTMELDNIGSPDLDVFKEIKRMQKLPEEVVNKNVLTVMYSDVIGSNEFLFFNDKKMLSGRKLKSLEQQANTQGKFNAYKQTEKFHLKVYTFLADLTRRMMNHNSEVKRDMGFYNVFGQAQRTLSNILGDYKAAEGFMITALNNNNNVPFQALAKTLNDKIAHTMNIFFR